MKSIKSKIVTIIAIVCIVSVALCSSISYYFSYKAIMAESTNKVSMASQKYSEMINGWLLTKAKLMDSMVVDFQYNNKYDQKYIYSYFQSQLKDNKDVIGMYVGFEDKNLYPVMDGYQLKIMIVDKEIGIKKLLKKME